MATRTCVKVLILLLLPGYLAAQDSSGSHSPAKGESDIGLRYKENISLEWEECIGLYRRMADSSDRARLIEIGYSDAGKPLHLFIISADGCFEPEDLRESGKNILFINNGIHPGESCGIDASVKLAYGLLSGRDEYAEFLSRTTILILPVFNIGGALKRSPYHRANQNGPREHGFRGNARNLDLNRDFMKMDAANTRALVPLLRKWDPDVFIDTHTSNGADYPYTITLINSHEQRHESASAHFLRQEMLPFLYAAMTKTPYEMSPYVWSIKTTPEDGLIGFMDYPRYTSGYTSMFNCLSLTVETHMFKPYPDRVLSTWHLLRESLHFMATHSDELQAQKAKAWKQKRRRRQFVLEWKPDTLRCDSLLFKGYAARYRKSKLTGHQRLYYDRSEPWEKKIPYYRYYIPTISCSLPEAYLIPPAWPEVIERLRLNGVEMQPLDRDTILRAEYYYIEDFHTASPSYNGHYPHSSTRVRKESGPVECMAGSILVPTKQKAVEYIVQALEPQAHDSFFNWNFFDEILYRNEYFSPYIFEETAEALLREDPRLNAAFRKKKAEDAAFAADPYSQLRFIYESSPWSEDSYMRYPVIRIPAR
ncbi:MAG: hypothetical protein CSA96_02420 [Bacteroidetes bacterium]|nr:MAG: hypothetical protein CSA96_02420 [Bacteroidota bacterium]